MTRSSCAPERARITTRTIAARALVAGALLGAATMPFAAQPASAAQFDYPAAVDPASIVVTTTDGGDDVTVWQRLRVDATWSVPDGARPGQTFGFTLPPQFSGFTSSFSLPSADDPDRSAAECVVSADAPPVVTCTLTDYVDGRTDVGGSLWFLVSATQTTDAQSVGFEVDGRTVFVDLPGGGGIGPGGGLPREPQKWGWQNGDGTLQWELVIPGSRVSGLDSIVVDDELSPAGASVQAHRNVDGELDVWSQNQSDTDPRGVDGWTGAWNADGTAFHLEIPGPIDADRWYLVSYTTVPDDAYVGDVYANEADVSGIRLSTSTEWQASGGGDGSGQLPGRFSIRKAVTGDGAGLVPDGTLFTVRYTSGAPGRTESLRLAPGEPAALGLRAPAGTVYTIEEIDLPAVAGIEWGEPSYTGVGVVDLGDGRAQVTPAAGETIEITLTNSAEQVVAPTPTPTPTATAPASPAPSTPAPSTPASSTPAAPGTTTGPTPPGGLAETGGGGVPPWIAGSAGLALLAGIVVANLAAIRSRRVARDETAH